MIAGEGQAKHWMKLAWWEHTEQDSEKETPNFWQSSRTLAEDLHWAIRVTFPKSVDWIKIQICTPKPEEYVRNYCNKLQVVYKENYCFLSDVEAIQVTFNSVY